MAPKKPKFSSLGRRHRWQNVSAYWNGDDGYTTPNIDRIG
jgi:hypothetical protein